MKTTLRPDNARPFRFAITDHKFGVDPATGALTNVQLMAAGREAKGHGVYIDERTLETGLEAIQERGGRLKSYVTHNHAGPCSWDSPDMDEASSELNIPGFFSGIAVKKSQLVAGTFEFYDAFKANFKPQFDQLVEMARKTPDLLGISAEVWGYLVYVGKDGVEYSGEPDDVELEYNGMPALRITDFWAAAFVGDGAATDGLFAQLSSKVSRLFAGKRPAVDRAELASAFAKFAAELAADPAAAGATVPLSRPRESASPHAESTSEKSTMKIIADLKAKITDPKQFASAMAIVGNTPADKLATLTVGDVETQLADQAKQAAHVALTAERDDLKSQVASLTTERDGLKSQVASLTTERDQWKTKFETLKTSGKDKDVNLGAGGNAGGGATADEPNPFAPATLNRARQAQIYKADPVRAAALKAAAGVK